MYCSFSNATQNKVDHQFVQYSYAYEAIADSLESQVMFMVKLGKKRTNRIVLIVGLLDICYIIKWV